MLNNGEYMHICVVDHFEKMRKTKSVELITVGAYM